MSSREKLVREALGDFLEAKNPENLNPRDRLEVGIETESKELILSALMADESLPDFNVGIGNEFMELDAVERFNKGTGTQYEPLPTIKSGMCVDMRSMGAADIESAGEEIEHPTLDVTWGDWYVGAHVNVMDLLVWDREKMILRIKDMDHRDFLTISGDVVDEFFEWLGYGSIFDLMRVDAKAPRVLPLTRMYHDLDEIRVNKS